MKEQLFFSNRQALGAPQCWWAEIAWFGQIVIFQVDYEEIELQSNSYDVISVSHHYVTEKRHQNNVTNFFHFKSIPLKISGYAGVRSAPLYITGYLLAK